MPQPGSRDLRLCVNRLYCFAIPYVWLPTPEQRERGVRLVIGDTERISSRSVDPRVKNYHWLDFEQALLSAYDSGGDNVVLPDDKGLVTEGAGFNIFVVRDGVLKTPATNVLEGITRMTVLDIARELGLPAEAGDVTVEDLRTADEAFGASTAGGIFFFTSVDGTPLGDGRVRPAHAARSTTRTGPGTTIRASRSRSPTCRRSRARRSGHLNRRHSRPGLERLWSRVGRGTAAHPRAGRRCAHRGSRRDRAA